MSDNVCSAKSENYTRAELLALIFFGCSFSLIVLRVAMWSWSDVAVRASLIGDSAFYWLIAYALCATWAFIQRRRSQ
jgi:hypothetical protein